MKTQKTFSRIIELDLSKDIEIHKNYIFKIDEKTCYVTNIRCVQIKDNKIKVEFNYKEDQTSKWFNSISKM